MTITEYLQAVLADQNLRDDSAELKDLQSQRAIVEKLIREAFGSEPVIRYGGSKAKGTLIKESYDLDVVSYIPCGSTIAGETLEDIYHNTRDSLANTYRVEEKTSALRLRAKDPKDLNRDFHIDVVPGRFTDDQQADCFIYQKSAEKCRLKTNLETHLAYIKTSGVLEAIRLLKLWKTRKAIGIKQFAFELLIIDLLARKRNASLEDQLLHVWTEICESENPIGTVDPANPTGNDLFEPIKAAWPVLSVWAGDTLRVIKHSGWEPVFGKMPESVSVRVEERARRAAATVAAPNQPWCA